MFKIQGQVYHNIINIVLCIRQMMIRRALRRYAQVYFLDTIEATECRLGSFTKIKLNKKILSDIDKIIREINPFAKAYKMASDVLEAKKRQMPKN